MSSKKTATPGSKLLWSLAITALLCAPLSANAQTWTVIHDFGRGMFGGGPAAGVTRDAAGNLYGTTSGGWLAGPARYGTVFKLAPTATGWVFTRLYVFNRLNGASPVARVIFGPDGALYGTTSSGGDCCGTVYRLQPSRSCNSGNCPWTMTILHSFQGSDGTDPTGDLAFDQHGNIYGTTASGGSGPCNGQCGVVFKLTRSGESLSYSVLYSFVGTDDGANPDGGVVLDASGNLYGTTVQGGGNGVVFQLTPSGSGWTESVLYRFTTFSDGAQPHGGLIFDRSGNLYGSTSTDGEYDAGTVFELTRENGGWSFAVLASLQTLPGSGPEAKLAMDGNGALYGTAWSGLVFKLTPSDNNWILTQLGSGAVGMTGSVVVDSNGVIYGTDTNSGDYNEGSVFEITQ